MKTKYETVSLRKADGFKRAEELQGKGWKVGSCGFDTVQLYFGAEEKKEYELTDEEREEREYQAYRDAVRYDGETFDGLVE